MPMSTPATASALYTLRTQAEVDYVNRHWFRGTERVLGSEVLGLVRFAPRHAEQFNRAMGYYPCRPYDGSHIEPLPLPG